MANGVSAVDYRKDTGPNDFICDWSSHLTRAIRQRVSWLPERMGHEMDPGKNDGNTIPYNDQHHRSCERTRVTCAHLLLPQSR
jgi:hypothetical protein